MRNLIFLTPQYPIMTQKIVVLHAYFLPKLLLRWGWRTITITQWTGEPGESCTIEEIPERLRGLAADELVVLPIRSEASLGQKLINFSSRVHRMGESVKRMHSIGHVLGSSLSAVALLTGETHLTGGGWTQPAARAASRTAQVLKADAMLAMVGWDAAFAAQRCHRDTGVPWVHYFLDAWQMFVVPLAQPVYGAYFHRSLLPSAAAICHCTPGWAHESCLELHRPVTCIIGGYNAEHMATFEAKESDHFTVVYVGSAGIGVHQDPDRFFAGVAKLCRDAPELANDLEVLYIGWDQKVFRQRAAEAGVLERLRCLGKLPPEEVIPYLKGAHLLLMMLDQTVDYNVGRLCAKMGEYVGAGRPILLIGQTDKGRETDLVRLIRDGGIGWVAQNADEVAVLLRRLLEQYNATGSTPRPGGGKYPTGDFSWQRQAQKLALVLDSVARGERDPVVEDLAVEYPWSVTD
ncbi:MAG: hypothetical protein E4H01_11345 [Lysobacterales bacterium]|nr:MAG: hypothetical protein E4H01_11345 [Xanthomonadales bacterium]